MTLHVVTLKQTRTHVTDIIVSAETPKAAEAQARSHADTIPPHHWDEVDVRRLEIAGVTTIKQAYPSLTLNLSDFAAMVATLDRSAAVKLRLFEEFAVNPVSATARVRSYCR